MAINQKISIFISSLILTIITLRFFLSIFPSANLNISRYNIHHLYVGSFLVIVASIFFITNIINNFVIALAGFGSALVLDEIIYLIATDGSDSAYLTAISLYGAIILTAIILLITGIAYYTSKQKVRE